MRARELGIEIGGLPPGERNAISDVPGVRVGHVTVVRGEGPLVVGEGPVRTGVTVVVPHNGDVSDEPVFAGCHRLNGNGEVTGLEWMRESGLLSSPVALTNTHSVGVVRDALVRAAVRDHPGTGRWSLPVVAETWDGALNDIDGMHVNADHVDAALVAASPEVAEGGVGGGTGMICHGFKGGIGTASRIVESAGERYCVGLLVQANHGRRARLRVDGEPVGEAIGPEVVPLPGPAAAEGSGSIIAIVATDAPLLPHQCARLAQRAGLGVARAGGVGEHFSGDLFVAFATGNRGLPGVEYSPEAPDLVGLSMVPDRNITRFFDAVVEATEEAILNALLAAETMTGRDGNVAHALDPELLRSTFERLRPK